MSASDDNLTVKTKQPEDYLTPKLSFNFFDMTDDELEVSQILLYSDPYG